MALSARVEAGTCNATSFRNPNRRKETETPPPTRCDAIAVNNFELDY